MYGKSGAKGYQYLSTYNDNLVITFLCALVVEHLTVESFGEVLLDSTFSSRIIQCKVFNLYNQNVTVNHLLGLSLCLFC